MNNKKQPFFSVVIPTHNRTDLLSEALDSVLKQTFADFEILVVDDNSTDHTKSIVESYADKDSRIKYFLNNRTKGGGGVRNVGISHSNGTWVAFLDDDDVWLPEKLEVFYNEIKQLDESTGFLYSGYSLYYSKINKAEKFIQTPKEGNIYKDLLYKNWIGTFSVAVIRRDILLKINGLDERFPSSQDMDLYIRVAELTKVKYIDKYLTLYRVDNTDNITKNFKKKIDGFLLLEDKYENAYSKNLKLKQRLMSQIFLYSIAERDWKNVRKAFPFMLTGIFLDPHNFLLTSGSSLKKAFRKR